MAISLNPANLAAAQSFLKQVGLAVDPSSSRGAQVSVEEAQKLEAAFDAIPDAGTRKAVGAALLKLIQADAFEVPSKTAQDVIAKLVGQPTDQVFSARDKANLVGGASIKTVAAATMGLLAKMPNLDKAQVEKLTTGLDALPKEVKNFVHAVFNKAGKDGEVKFQPDARSTFTKSYAKAEGTSEGAVSKMEQSFAQKAPNGALEHFAATMGNSPYFEDRLAALMFMICAKTMNEVDGDLKGLDNLSKKDAERNAAKGQAARQQTEKANAAQAASSSSSAAAAGKDAVSQLGQVQKGPAASTSATTQLRTSYESVVSSATALRGNDGIITEAEARSLVGKLDKISPPEAKVLQANAMGRAILAVGGGELTPELAPLAHWVETTTGKKLTDVADAKALYESKAPLAAAIGGSDKLENKVAAFIVDGIFGDKAGAPKLAAVMKEMKPLFSAMESEVTGKSAEAERAEAPKFTQHTNDMEMRFTRIANAVTSGKLPVGELAGAAKTLVDRLPISADKKALLDGVTAGLGALVGDKSLDVKQVFSKAVGPLVNSAAKDSPDFAHLVDGAVETAREKTFGTLFSAKNERNEVLTAPQIMKTLEGDLAASRSALLKEAAANGHEPAQLEAMGAAFDQRAQNLRDEAHATGTISSRSGLGADSADALGTDESRSRQIMFEALKLKMSRLSEMMQAMSNILNSVHQIAENAVRAIR